MEQSQRVCQRGSNSALARGITGQPVMMQALNNLKSMRKEPGNWRRSTSAKGRNGKFLRRKLKSQERE